MIKKLPTGTGMARARHSRSRTTDVVCNECLHPLSLVQACTCRPSNRHVLRRRSVKGGRS
jgi:hypothetical protein